MAPHNELPTRREYRSLAAVRADWEHRFPADNGAYFARLEWFDMLARHCFADATLRIGCAILPTERGEHVALLPMVEMQEGLCGLANWYSFSFAPLFSTTDADIRLALLELIARDLRGAAGRIAFHPVLEEGGGARLLYTAFRKAGWWTVARDMGHNHVLRLKARTFAEYWAARCGNLRRRVKRKGKGAPYAFTLHTQWTDALWQDYETIYAASWKGAESHPAMVRVMAQEAAMRGALRLAFAHDTAGNPVAVQFWTVEGGVALVHKIAHDSSHDAGSPGTLLAHYMFAHAIDHDRVSMIDYGTGDNGYKREWMEEERPMWRIDCFEPRAPRQWLAASRALISSLAGRRKGR